MTINDFKRIARLLKESYKELEDNGILVASDEYDKLVALIRDKILAMNGFTLEEYRKAKKQYLKEKEATQKEKKQAKRFNSLITKQTKERVTKEYVKNTVADAIKKNTKPPQVINKIVKEVTIEKPKIVETVREITKKETYDDRKLWEELSRLNKILSELNIPEPLDTEALEKKLKEEYESDFSALFEKSINTLNMPNFRKLGMGLQQQIDDIIEDMANQTEYKIDHAIDVILETYGVNVSVDKKKKDLLKFGRNPNVGSAATGYTIWATGADNAHETYVAANTNSIDSISSSTSGDTNITFVVEGHTESGGNKTFVTQSVTTNGTDGQTRVALTTPLNRVTRAYNNGSTAATGPIYIYENTALTSGKPTDTTKIHLTIPTNRNQSEKASTSLSSTDYWIITGFRGSMLEKAASFADVALQVRINGKLFREVEDVSCSDASNGIMEFNPYIIAPANSDIRLVAVSDSTSRDVSGGIQGFLAKVIS